MGRMRALGLLAVVLLGALPAIAVAAQGGGTLTSATMVGRGGGAELLFVPKVQAELKLTDPQKAQVRQFEERTVKDLVGLAGRIQSVKPEERQKLVADLIAGQLKEAMAILTPEQQSRFRQLSLQTQGMLALAQPPIAEELKLTSEQRERIRVIVQEQQQALARLVVQGGLGSNPQARVETLLKETDSRLLPLLTEDQKTRWTALLGPPLR